MAKGSVSYELSARADQDLSDILRYGLQEFGERRAVAYFNALLETIEQIGAMPQAYMLRDVGGLQIRVAPHSVHVILYEIQESGTAFILTIRGARENWQGYSL